MFKDNKNLLVIAVIAVVNALGYGIVIPILYSYSKHFGLTDWQNGLLFSTFSFCAFISTPIIGKLSDKYGRRPLLLISVAGTAISFFMQAFAPNAIFLFLARALDGLTAGNISVASAIIADTTKPQDRAKGFGIIGAAFGFGFVAGPAISASTVGIWMPLPFVIAGVVTTISWILTYFVLPETNAHKGQIAHDNTFDLTHLWHGLFDSKLGNTFKITILYSIAFSCAMMYGFQPFAKNILKLSDSSISMAFVFIGVVGLIMQSFFVQKISKSLGTMRAFKISVLIVASAFLLYCLVNSYFSLILVMIVMASANSLAQPLINTILSLETEPKNQGHVMGMNTSYMNAGQIFGPIIGGLIASYYIRGVFVFGASLLLVCIFLARKISIQNNGAH